MAVLYTLVINNPNWQTVDPFPMSVIESTWFPTLTTAVQARGFVVTFKTISSGNQLIIFDSVEEMNSFLDEHRLTDPTLIADLNEWKAAHNITFTSKAYSLTSTDVPILNPIFK